MKAHCMATSGGRDPVADEWAREAEDASKQAAMEQEWTPAAREQALYRQNLAESARAACPDC